MPVWLAIGGVVVGAIVNYSDHSDYSDYSNHSDYSDYSNYSDAAERQRIRRESARNEYESAKKILCDTKKNELDKYLKGTKYENVEADECVPITLELDITQKISAECDAEIQKETCAIDEQIKEIDIVLNKLNIIKKELSNELEINKR